MTKIRKTPLAAAVLMATGAAMAQDQLLLVLDSGNDAVAAFDPADGTLIDPVYIDLVPFDPGTPKGIARVNDELWISDQIRDRVDRFTLDGAFIDTIGGSFPGSGLDNLRGLSVIGDEVWLLNSGTQNDAPGNAIVRLDPSTGAILGNILLDSGPWFALPYNGEVLLSFSGDSRIDRLDESGSTLGVFLERGQLNFIQQLSETSAGTVLAGAFSSPSGVYEIDVDGSLIGLIDGTADSGARAGVELGDGSILWTNGAGVNISDPTSGATLNVLDGSGQFIALLGDAEPCYADFDGDGTLTIFDFLAFQNAFDAGDLAADCDEDASLTLFDFLCFQNAFDAGCE